MALPFYNWSRTASNNATADATINWAEGQSPSSVNDSARAMMASTAAFRDDIAGGIITGGTSTAYTVSTYQVFDSLAHLDGKVIAFLPHTTNGAGPVTLNVDGLGAKTLRADPNIDLPAGVLVAVTPYTCYYDHANSIFRLHNVYANPYNIPIGASVDFWGTSAPNSSFALMYGQAISRTTYATLFSMFGTTYGSGDGSTTFNIPDLRGRVVAGKDDMGGSAASRLTSSYFGTGAATLGGVGSSSESTTLTLAQLPTGITSSNTGNISLSVTTTLFVPAVSASGNLGSAVGGGTQITVPATQNVGGQLASTGTLGAGTVPVTSNNTSGNAHRTVQPTIIGNKLLRLI